MPLPQTIALLMMSSILGPLRRVSLVYLPASVGPARCGVDRCADIEDMLWSFRAIHFAQAGGIMRRREFLDLVVLGLVWWPIAASAQSHGVPVIGFLNRASPG